MNTKFAARAWGDFRSRWRASLAYHLVIQVLGIALIAPLLTLIASWLVSRSGEPVISNFELASFVLSPLGILSILVMAALLLSLLLAEFAGHTWIAAHAMTGRPVSLPNTVAVVLRLVPKQIVLGARIFLRLLLLALPFLAGLAVVWFTMLSDHDINFYLTEHPPQWRRALLIAGVLGLGYAYLVQRQLSRWLYAIPVMLFEKTSPRAALMRSRELTEGRAFRVALPLVLWFVALTVATLGITWLCRHVSDAGLDWAGISAARVLPLVTIYALVSLLGGFLYGALWLTGHQFMITRLYVESLGEAAWQPPALGPQVGRTERRFAFPILTALPVLLLLGGAVMWFIATRIDLEKNVDVTAHRGASIAAPENTRAAFQAALDAGADFIELDVQRTRDQVIVVVHDGDLLRLGGDPRRVKDLSLQELDTIDVGAKYNASFTGQFPPTLEQVIDLVGGRMKINIELKYNFPDPGLAPAVIALLRSRGVEDEVVITSLDYNAIRQVESLEPQLITGLIVTASVGNMFRSEADFLSLNAAKATPSVVRHAHRAGKKVHVWTVNTEVAMLRMIERGVDNIITDDPALLVRVIRERRALNRSQLLGLRLRALFAIPPPEISDPAAVKTL